MYTFAKEKRLRFANNSNFLMIRRFKNFLHLCASASCVFSQTLFKNIIYLINIEALASSFINIIFAKKNYLLYITLL